MNEEEKQKIILENLKAMYRMFIEMDTKQALEAIQSNLANKIDIIYIKANELIGIKKVHDLGMLKEGLKDEIHTNLMIMIWNVIDKLETRFEWRRYFEERDLL